MKNLIKTGALIAAITVSNVLYAQLGSLKGIKVSKKADKAIIKSKNVDLEIGKNAEKDDNNQSDKNQESNNKNTQKSHPSNPVFTPSLNKGQSAAGSNTNVKSGNDQSAANKMPDDEESFGHKLKQNQFTLDKIIRYENAENVSAFLNTYKSFNDYMTGPEMRRAIEISQKKDNPQTRYYVDRNAKNHQNAVKDYAEQFKSNLAKNSDAPEILMNERIKSSTGTQDNLQKVQYLDQALFIGKCGLFFDPENQTYKSAIAKATAVKDQITAKQNESLSKVTNGDAIHKKYLNQAICSNKPFPASVSQVNEADLVTSISTAGKDVFCAIPLSSTFKTLRAVDDPFFTFAVDIDENAHPGKNHFKVFMTGKDDATYLTFNLIPSKSYIDNYKFGPSNKAQEEELRNAQAIVKNLSEKVYASTDHTIDFVFLIVDDQQPSGGIPRGRGHRYISTTLKVNVTKDDLTTWGEMAKAIEKKFQASVHMSPATLNNPSYLKGLKERFATGWPQYEYVTARIVGKNYTLDNRWENGVYTKGRIIDMEVVGKYSDGTYRLITISAGRNESSPGVYEGEFYVRVQSASAEILPENIGK